MNKEFKKITLENEIRYVLESATGGSSSSAGGATLSLPLSELQKRIKSLKEKVSGTPKKAPPPQRNFVAKNAPKTGAGSHKPNQRQQARDEKKIYELGDDQPDHEISMASSELKSIAADAADLLDMIKQRSEEEGLEAWQQSKITKAADFMNSVLQSISGDEEPDDSSSSIFRGKPDVRMLNQGVAEGVLDGTVSVNDAIAMAKKAFVSTGLKGSDLIMRMSDGSNKSIPVVNGRINLATFNQYLRGGRDKVVGVIGGENAFEKFASLYSNPDMQGHPDPLEAVKLITTQGQNPKLTAQKIINFVKQNPEHYALGDSAVRNAVNALQKQVGYVREQGVAEAGYGDLDGLMAKFKATINRILDREASGEKLSDTEERAIELLQSLIQGENEGVAEDRDPEAEITAQQRAQADATVRKQHAAYTAATQAPYEKMSDEELQNLVASIEKQIDQIARQSHGDDYRPGSPLRQASNKAEELSSKLRTIQQVLDKRGIQGVGEDEYKPAQHDPLAARREFGKVYRSAYPQDDNPYHKAGLRDPRGTQMHAYAINRTGPRGQLPGESIEKESDSKIKGVDGKACWKGKRYAGRVKKADGTYKDKCVPVSEDAYINKLMAQLESKK